VGGAGQDFWELLRDANQFMFCGTAIPNAKTIGWGAVACPRHKKEKPKPSTKERSSTEHVALRSQLDYEVAWRGLPAMSQKKGEPATSALTFYDLLIEEAHDMSG
jgi:hypothetical protein